MGTFEFGPRGGSTVNRQNSVFIITSIGSAAAPLEPIPHDHAIRAASRNEAQLFLEYLLRLPPPAVCNRGNRERQSEDFQAMNKVHHRFVTHSSICTVNTLSEVKQGGTDLFELFGAAACKP